MSPKIGNIFKPKNRKYLAGVSILVVLLLGLLLLTLGKGKPSIEPQDVSVVIEKDDSKINVRSDGFVQFTSPKTSLFQTWDTDKTKNLIRYLASKGKVERLKSGQYKLTFVVDGQQHILYLDENDPVGSEIFTPINNGGDGGSGDGGGGGFTFASPTPIGGSGGGLNSTPTPTPGSTPAPTGNQGECPLWLVNYCDLQWGYNAPTIAPTIDLNSPTPDCAYWNQFIKGNKAVVSNTLCTK